MKDFGKAQSYACYICEESFLHFSDIVAHARLHLSPISSVSQDDVGSQLGVTPFVCGVCGKAFAQADTLLAHIENHPMENPKDLVDEEQEEDDDEDDDEEDDEDEDQLMSE